MSIMREDIVYMFIEKNRVASWCWMSRASTLGREEEDRDFNVAALIKMQHVQHLGLFDRFLESALCY